ncbi:hypothetical protein JTB14_006550 [Gonioctena quinquepunctata]|nr:hypothetical protein JTB14_006550 [Gonioctena quinquepunctata]
MEKTDKENRNQIDFKDRDLHWLIGKKSKSSLENKLLYNPIIKAIWRYGFEIWACTGKTKKHHEWYISNGTLHEDLQVLFVKDTIKEKSRKHHVELEIHNNPSHLLEP